ncbi:MAG: hypothetical protein M1840_006644 [Geoglossum simile]|nr:MAG: hypothetical protein M1840_006644 [Geoglossum simile]
MERLASIPDLFKAVVRPLDQATGPISVYEMEPNPTENTKRSHETAMNVRTVLRENFVGSASWEVREEKTDAP